METYDIIKVLLNAFDKLHPEYDGDLFLSFNNYSTSVVNIHTIDHIEAEYISKNEALKDIYDNGMTSSFEEWIIKLKNGEIGDSYEIETQFGEKEVLYKIRNKRLNHI